MIVQTIKNPCETLV